MQEYDAGKKADCDMVEESGETYTVWLF